jgi:hypothetical protein
MERLESDRISEQRARLFESTRGLIDDGHSAYDGSCRYGFYDAYGVHPLLFFSIFSGIPPRVTRFDIIIFPSRPGGFYLQLHTIVSVGLLC